MIKRIRRWWRRRRLSDDEKLFIDLLAAYQYQKAKHKPDPNKVRAFTRA